MKKLLFETDIKMNFHYGDAELSPEEQASLDALNYHAAEIAELLQAPMRNIAASMLELKRQIYGKGVSNEGPDNAEIPSNQRENS